MVLLFTKETKTREIYTDDSQNHSHPLWIEEQTWSKEWENVNGAHHKDGLKVNSKEITDFTRYEWIQFSLRVTRKTYIFHTY